MRQPGLQPDDVDEAVFVLHGNYRTQNLTEFLKEAMLRFARRVPAVYSVDHRKPIFLPTT